MSTAPHEIGPDYLDELLDHERRAQREDADRRSGLRAACFVALCIFGTIAFGFGWAAIEIITH